MRYTEPYHNAVAIQRVVKDAAIAEGTDKRLLANLARAYVDLEMLKLRLRMKPAPKPVDVSHEHGSKAKRAKQPAAAPSFDES